MLGAGPARALANFSGSPLRSSAGQLRGDPVQRGAPLSTNQDLDPLRLREAFGIFPSGAAAVAAEVNEELIGLALRTASRLGVTILADHHGDVCRQLAGPVR